MYGEHPNGSDDMGKIVTDWHCDRLRDLISDAGGEIIYGGGVNKEIKYVEPTIIVDPKEDSTAMNEEIFGPILPIISF
jgi:acyl-CoA reductase-like NAD-dependent aldehyde dehydrogenase